MTEFQLDLLPAQLSPPQPLEIPTISSLPPWVGPMILRVLAVLTPSPKVTGLFLLALNGITLMLAQQFLRELRAHRALFNSPPLLKLLLELTAPLQ
jgi:hypothetical protein